MRRLTMPLLCLFGLLPAFAQTPTPAPETTPKPEEVDIHFSVYVWPTSGILHEGSRLAGVPRAYMQTPEGLEQVPLAANTATPLMRYRGPLPLELFDVEKIVTPPPENAPPGTPPTIRYNKFPRISASFPASWNQVMLIVFPGRTNEDGTLVTLPLKYGVDTVRPGFIRIHNTTDRGLVLQVDDASRGLPAHGFLDIPAASASAAGSKRLNFIGRDNQNRPRMLYTTTVTGREEEGNLYVLYARDPRRLRLLRVGGHKPVPTPAPTATAPPSANGSRR